jgi:hypothetical protein
MNLAANKASSPTHSKRSGNGNAMNPASVQVLRANTQASIREIEVAASFATAETI